MSRRAAAVAQAVDALEAYGDLHDSYVVAGGGGAGDGQGWYQYTDNASYPTSIASVLVSEGHLSASFATDPLDTNYDHHLRVGNDFLVYRCKDRIAVFAQPQDPSFQASPADQAWWSANDCIDYPTTTLGHTYFEISKPLNLDIHRANAVNQALTALEAYGENNQSYVVSGGGGVGDGQGWYQYTDNASYQTSIADVLVNEGHLPTEYITDPLDTNYDHHLRIGIDMLVYRCQDRIAVFASTDGQVVTSADDADWWATNGCIDYPITTFGFSYFRVSKPLTSHSLCNGQAVTVDLSLGQMPTEGDDIIIGTPGDDNIQALGGDDIICALAGDDYIDAGPGHDLIIAGTGNDEVLAGSGTDRARQNNYLDEQQDSYDGQGAPAGTDDKVIGYVMYLPPVRLLNGHASYAPPVGWTRLM